MSLNTSTDVNDRRKSFIFSGDVVCIKSNYKIVSYIIDGTP